MSDQSRSNFNNISITLLTLATAGIHISLLFPDVVFILNGLGYLTLLGAYRLPISIFQERRKLIRWIFIGFTGVTIIAWLAIGDKSWPGGSLGYLTKLIEVVLAGLLLSERNR